MDVGSVRPDRHAKRGSATNFDGRKTITGENFRRTKTPLTTSPNRPFTANEVLRGGVFQKEDESFKRLVKTPRVFHRGKDVQHNRRGELRSNLLPSILQCPPPSENLSRQQQEGPPPADPAVEADGEFYRLYQDELTARDEVENQVKVFLEKDTSQQPQDPAHLVAQNCVLLKDLLEPRAGRFRRPKDSILNLDSDLPFSHAEKEVDLEEITNILTLDLQYRKGAASKLPGFASLQISARVPLTLKDPAGEGEGAIFNTESLRGSDLHTVRVDLEPGEVRQVAYNLGSRHFKNTALSARMAAVVEPENGVLSGIIQSLRAKEAEALGVERVLNDILRDVSNPLPPLDTSAWATSEGPADGLEDTLVAEPRRTLGRLLDAADALAAVAQPLAASLAHGIDRLGLICVREVDRMANQFCESLQKTLKAWSVSEKGRLQALDIIERIGGDKTGGDEMKSRIKILEAELRNQETTFARLLREKMQLEASMQADAQVSVELSRKVKELEQANAKLLQERRVLNQRLDAFAELKAEPMEAEPMEVPLADATTDGEPLSGGELEAEPLTPQSQKAEVKKPRGKVKASAPLLSFSVSTAVQTATDVLYWQGEQLESDMDYESYDHVLRTASRLYTLLCQYEWNLKANSYLLRPDDDMSEDSDGEPKPAKDKTGSRRQATASKKLTAMQTLKSKVQKAHREASIAQLEEEVIRLEGLGKKSFDEWIARLAKDAGSSKKAATELPINPDKLYDAVIELVKGEGMRRRIRELEEHLSELLPMADRMKGATGATNTDVGFWKRVLRSVRQSMASRRGSTFSKAQVQGAMQAAGPNGQRASVSLGNRSVILNDLSRLQGELAAIWASLPDKPEKAKGSLFLVKPVAQQVLQEAVKGFYLRSCGRQKQVEQAVFSLCRAVIDHSTSAKVALFAIMSDIMEPSTMAEKIPEWKRDAEGYLGRRLQKSELNVLPSDAAFVMFEFMTQLKAVSRSRMFPGANDGSLELLQNTFGGTQDHALPLQLTLVAANQTIAKRSKAFARCFSMMLFGYAEFPSLRSLGKKPTTDLDAIAEDRVPEEAMETDTESEGPSEGPPGEALLLSHFLAADLFLRDQDAEAFVEDIWSWACLREGSRSETEEDQRMIVSHAAQVLEERYPTVPLPQQFTINALNKANVDEPDENLVRTGLGLSQVQMMSKQELSNLVHMWKHDGGAGSAVCLESHVHWAALWALAFERSYEIDLMGQVFVLFDTSGDGWMQFSEFHDFLKTVAPDTSENECSGLFMLAADDTSADMTKEVFINLVLRTGVTADVDELEQLVIRKKAELAA